METPQHRTINEICIDADNNRHDLDHLAALWVEVKKNLKKYPLVELEFMKEHLQGYAFLIVQTE